MKNIIVLAILFIINLMVYVNGTALQMQVCLRDCNAYAPPRKANCVHLCHYRYGSDSLKFDSHSRLVFEPEPLPAQLPGPMKYIKSMSFFPKNPLPPYDRKKEKQKLREWQRAEKTKKDQERKQARMAQQKQQKEEAEKRRLAKLFKKRWQIRFK